ncbi:MAG: winged helix-turn-helix domain-containing protein [Thaumarchaeota archaeon]|nr:winged helix-turn-helix domain-containing protein [Nitrososphaerota archaeon]
MKEVQLTEKSRRSNEVNSTSQCAKSKEKNKKKEILGIRATSPATAACEIPILTVLLKAPEKGIRALTVVQEAASSIWFPKLTDDDREARYSRSRKKIVSTTVRWARENLTLKGEIFAPGAECKAGIWRATSKGLARAKEQREEWTAKYTVRDAIIIADAKDK